MGLKSLNRVLRKLEKQGLIYYELEDYSRNQRVFCSDTEKITVEQTSCPHILIILLILLSIPVFLSESDTMGNYSSGLRSEYCRLSAQGRFGEVLKMQEEWPLLINIQDDYGWSALHWAMFYGREDVCNILKERGVKSDRRSTKKWFIYEKGALASDISCIENK